MSPRISDGKLACVAAACLIAIAAFVLFVIHPGGFETGIGWLLILLPGAFVGYPLSDHLYRLAPHAAHCILGPDRGNQLSLVLGNQLRDHKACRHCRSRPQTLGLV